MDSFGAILDAALAKNLEQQISNKSVKYTLPQANWLQEFGTVAISLGRATGKTTAIARRASSSDLVITYSHYTALDLSKMCLYNPIVKDIEGLIRSVPGAQYKKFDRIWVDNASMILGAHAGYILKLASEAKAIQLILVG